MRKTGICALCGGTFTHFGNNPEPLLKYEERVCDDCNSMHVIPARLLEMMSRREQTK